MKCEKCGKEFYNTCINCGCENHTQNSRCPACLHVVNLNIEHDKKIKSEGLPIPNEWNQIMRESLNPDVICPDCIKSRSDKIYYDNKRFWIKFRHDFPI